MDSTTPESEARVSLITIIDTYFSDPTVRKEMIDYANQPRPPVKHIFDTLQKLDVEIDPKHSESIKEIFFFWG